MEWRDETKMCAVPAPTLLRRLANIWQRLETSVIVQRDRKMSVMYEKVRLPRRPASQASYAMSSLSSLPMTRSSCNALSLVVSRAPTRPIPHRQVTVTRKPALGDSVILRSCHSVQQRRDSDTHQIEQSRCKQRKQPVDLLRWTRGFRLLLRATG